MVRDQPRRRYGHNRSYDRAVSGAYHGIEDTLEGWKNRLECIDYIVLSAH